MSAAVMKEARCISCGCTERFACMVSVGGVPQGCFWILVDRAKGEGLCSACATLPQLVCALLSPEDPLAHHPSAGVGTTVSELADYTTTSPARVRRALATLEAKGLAERGAQLQLGGWVWYRGEPR